MTAPRHLWSGDWELESSARRDELASGRVRPQAPAEPEPATQPPRRSTPTLGGRLRAIFVRLSGGLRRGLRAALKRLRPPSRRQVRVAAVVAALALVGAGAAYAVTSAIGGSSTQTPAAANQSGAWLGIAVTTSPYGGVMVTNVVPGSPAYWAGMEAGDVITRLGGRQVLTPSDVRNVISGTHPGQHVGVQFQGSGTTYNRQIQLGNQPAGTP